MRYDTFFGFPCGTNILMEFLETSGCCLLSRKVWWGVQIGSFCPILRYFTDQSWLFSNTKVNVTHSKTRKSRWKNGVICIASLFPFWVMVIKLSKKFTFCNFALTSTRNRSLLNQFTDTHWATVHEILAIKISKKMLTQQKFNKILRIHILILRNSKS